MKKLFVLLMVLVFAFSVSMIGCEKKQEAPKPAAEPAAQPAPAPAPAPAPTPAPKPAAKPAVTKPAQPAKK